MSQILLAVGVVLVLAVLALLAWLITSNLATRREIAGQGAGIGLLQQQLEALKAAQDRTSQTLQSSLQVGQSALAQNLQANQQTLNQLNRQIGELQGTNKQMLQLGTDVKRLQDILSSPKLRGQIGEWSLENLLAQALPGQLHLSTRSRWPDRRCLVR
jgi:DNA anti-recombination protein RmuC